MHARRLSEKHVKRKVDRLVVKVFVVQNQTAFFGSGTHYGEVCTFTLTDLFKGFVLFGTYGKNITFLRFVTPEFVRRHAWFIVWNLAQFKDTAAVTVIYEFRESV